MQSPKCQKKGVCLIKIYSELKAPRVKSWTASDRSVLAAGYMHYASRCVPVLSLRSTAAAELEMVIDGIYKCHYCWHCGGRWLWDCFSVVMMIIFPFILLLRAMQEQCLVFFNVATETKVLMEMNVTLITPLVRPHKYFWFCFLFYESTQLLFQHDICIPNSSTFCPGPDEDRGCVCTSCKCPSL